jgi:hypothetical protein
VVAGGDCGGGAARVVAGIGGGAVVRTARGDGGAVVRTARGDGAAVVGDGDGDGDRVVAAAGVALGDGVPFLLLAWAATLMTTKNAIAPSTVSTLCPRTHNLQGAGLRGA